MAELRYDRPIVQGSTKYAITSGPWLVNGVPIDFSTATSITFKAVKSDGQVVIDEEPATGTAAGVLTYVLDLTGDVDIPGRYQTQWTATWADTRPWRSPRIVLLIDPKL